MRQYVVPLAGFLLSILVQGLIANAAWARIGLSNDNDFIYYTFTIVGDVFNDRGSCHEDVHFTGTVHLVAEVRQEESGLAEIEAHFSLVDGQGMGATTGARYLVTGARQQVIAVDSLPTTASFELTFDWIPLGQCKLPRTQAAQVRVALVGVLLTHVSSYLSQVCRYDYNTGVFPCYN